MSRPRKKSKATQKTVAKPASVQPPSLVLEAHKEHVVSIEPKQEAPLENLLDSSIGSIIPAQKYSDDFTPVSFNPRLVRLEQLHRFAQRNKLITLMDWNGYTLEELQQPLAKLCQRSVAHIAFYVQGNRIVTSVNDQLFTGISLWELGNQSLIQNENFKSVIFTGLKETSTAGTFELILG